MQHQHCCASAACFHLRLKLRSLVLHDLHADSALLNLPCRLPNSPEPQGKHAGGTSPNSPWRYVCKDALHFHHCLRLHPLLLRDNDCAQVPFFDALFQVLGSMLQDDVALLVQACEDARDQPFISSVHLP